MANFEPDRRSYATFWVRAAVEAFALERLDVRWLLRQAGIAPPVLADPDARIPAHKVSRLWNLAIASSGSPIVGLASWQRANPGAFGVVAYAMMSAPNLRGLLKRLDRYGRIVSDAGTITLSRQRGGVLISLSLPKSDPGPVWEQVCFEALTLLAFCRFVTLSELRPLVLELSFRAPADLGRVHEALGFPVRFDAPTNAMLFSRADAERALPTAEPRLAPIHDRVATEHLRRLGYSGISQRTNALIRQHLPDGEPSRASIAAMLAMSERTLHRRLAAEGATFRKLVDVTRRELAKAYLHERSASLADAAYLLGFADQSGFHRAYRRWFGISPRAHRSEPH